MQINKIDNNTSFKMALKINTKAMPKLQELPIEKLREIEAFGEKLKDIKLYDVHLNERLKYEIRSVNSKDNYDYLAGLREAQSLCGRHYTRMEYDGGGETTIGGYYPDQPRSFITKYGKKAKEEYEKFKQLSLEDQITQYCKMLEEFELERIAKEEAEIAAKKAKEEAARLAQKEKDDALHNLMGKYGYEEPVVEAPQSAVEKQTIEKTNPIKRFFKLFWQEIIDLS